MAYGELLAAIQVIEPEILSFEVLSFKYALQLQISNNAKALYVCLLNSDGFVFLQTKLRFTQELRLQ